MARKHPMISKRWLINYVLILLICVFTYVGNRYQVQTGYQPENRISKLKPQDIEQIHIKTADQTIRLVKDGSSWQIESPLLWFANNIAVERIIDIVNSQTDSRLPSSEIDISTLGLQFPQAVLTLNQTDFILGDTNNIGERRYLLTDDTVFLVKDRHLPFISQGITGLLDRRLLPRALALRSLTANAYQLTLSSESSWQSDKVEHSKAAIDQLVSNWQTLEAKHIQHYQSNATPRQKITARLDNGRSLEFYVLSIQPEIVIARPDLGLQYHFAEKTVLRFVIDCRC